MWFIIKAIQTLADELGVTRQRIQQIITKQEESERPKKVAGKYQLDKKDEKAIIQSIKSIKIKQQKENNSSKETNEKQIKKIFADEIEFMKDQLNKKDKQLEAKDKQLCKMQKLLDQSQQLQLMAEKKIAALEAPKQAEDDADQSKESSVTSAPKGQKKEPTDNQKRGFWHKLFK